MKIIFKAGQDFEAFYNAEKWLKENGYSWGSMQRSDPIGITKENWIGGAKWRHLTPKGKAALDGIIEGESKRNGDITITIFDIEHPNPYNTDFKEE